jgi:serine/threonine protein kinase
LSEEDKTRRLFKEICRIVGCLHSKGIVHRDIKLENIMMSVQKDAYKIGSKSGSGQDSANKMNSSMISSINDLSQVQPKLIDFGLSKVLLPGEKSADPYGTLAYCSPEIIAKKPHTSKTDVWSLGIVLYTMLTRRMPFIASDEDQTKNNILYRNLNFDQP